MKIYELRDPLDQNYAQAAAVGTWTQPRGICPECSASAQVVEAPLIIEWLPDGNVVGDFTWLGWAVVVSSRAARSLSRKFRGFELASVEVRQGERHKPPVYPDGVQPLHHLRVTEMVTPLAESTIEVSACPACGTSKTYIHGMEQRKGDWDVHKMKTVTTDRARQTGSGLIVRASEVVSAGIFGLAGPSRYVFCTEGVKKFIEDHGFTNCGFREVGETDSFDSPVQQAHAPDHR